MSASMRLAAAIAAALTVAAAAAHAQQTTIDGPVGSVGFGERVLALPNGNVVVADPAAGGGVGAVHLYSPAGVRISTLFGSSPDDHVGSGGVKGVGDSHFVVVSPDWNNGAALHAGAVTWVDGTTGLNGALSAANSLVGTTTNDRVGINGVDALRVLANGNYVVNSWTWSNGGVASVGAVTWANGNTGIAGAVSAANSLVGTQANDSVGASGVYALANGHYVVASLAWSSGGVAFGGAVTWANGATGRTGPVTAANSLVGAKPDDFVGDGGVVALTNGHYVVSSSRWNNGTNAEAGAATLCDGAAGRVGTVSASNSLVGTRPGDQVGERIKPLANGNYVVTSTHWDNAAIVDAGAATWCHGVAGCVGTISVANSLIGTSANDGVGYLVVPLANGNYVTAASLWDNGALANAGAVTWGNGASGVVGTVSAANSLVGGKANDRVGISGVAALRNGNYVVGSRLWKNGAIADAGAATWGNGNTGIVGAVSVANSLVGTTAGDTVGHDVVALENGHYVVGSSFWNNGGVQRVGAVTWGSGVTGKTGAVATTNSLVGTKAQDQVGAEVAALANGHYVVGSRYWDNGAVVDAGAQTWVNGTKAYAGAVSTENSFVGSSDGDAIGSFGAVYTLADGNYIAKSGEWDLGPLTNSGVVTLAGGHYRFVGEVKPWNSVIPAQQNGGSRLHVAYDAPNERVIVGRPAENKVTLMRREQLFADRFD